VDSIGGGALPSALLSAMICFRHSTPYSVKAVTPMSTIWKHANAYLVRWLMRKYKHAAFSLKKL
jgi:hypothetical protein